MNPYHEPWTEYAQCREVGDPELWFPEKGGSHKEAIKVCGTCRVRLQCLDKAMRDEQGRSRYIRDGILGGLAPKARKDYEPQWLAEQAEEVLSNVA